MRESIALGNRDATQRLGSLMPQSLDCKLHVGFAEQRIFFPVFSLTVSFAASQVEAAEAAHVSDVELFRLPWL